jgi:hypothetical protein
MIKAGKQKAAFQKAISEIEANIENPGVRGETCLF